MKLFVLILTMLLLTFSCSPKKKEERNRSALEKSQPLIFLHYWSGNMRGGIEEMVHSFNRNSYGYEIKSASFDHESFKASVKVMLAGGNPPDLFSYWAGSRTENLVNKGYLCSLNSLWKEASLKHIFSPTVVKACHYKGNSYMMPVTQHFVTLFYNKSIFKKYNITPPETWEEFIAVCDKLLSEGITPISLGARNLWPAQFWFDYLLLRSAGPVYRESLMSGEASYTDLEVIHAFSLWEDMIKRGYFNGDLMMNDWADASAAVEEGQAAMTLMGTWILGFFDQNGLRQGVEYDYFHFPVIAKGVPKTALGPIDGIVLPKGGNKLKAEEVLKIFTERMVQKAMSVGSGSLSPVRGVLPPAEAVIQRRMHQELQEISYWAFNYDLATAPPVSEMGLQLFGKFLMAPEQYEGYLNEMQNDCESLDLSEWR